MSSITTLESTHTYTSDKQITVEVSDDDDFPHTGVSKKKKRQANKKLQEAEAEGAYLWERTKYYLFRPGVAGGLVGLINIGILAGGARAFYLNPSYRSDRTIIASTVAGSLALLSAEGYAAEKYAETPRGRDEARRAKEEGTLIYRHAREIVLRPGVLGGLVGLVNAGILGTVGYYSYINWDRPSWDKRVVSGVSIGLLALWTGEGFLAEQYHEGKRPHRK
eukprot:GHVU01159545.1.p1 GENE.GHVU01159545.1~~GHVU01159545.1.p1  ORF type:complete len:221 (+),score=33.42 GHVU01159545.1:174-836(+)